MPRAKPPAPARVVPATKTRLTAAMRSALYQLAKKTILTPKETTAERKAYGKVAALIRKDVDAKITPSDLVVLKRHDCVMQKDYVHIIYKDNRDKQLLYTSFKFDADIPNVWVKSNHYGTLISEPTYTSYMAWDAAVQAIKSAYETKYNDYASLIRSAKTLEEIEAVWPAAKAARTTPQTMSVSLLTPDLLTRIQADQAATKRYMARHPTPTQAAQPEPPQ